MLKLREKKSGRALEFSSLRNYMEIRNLKKRRWLGVMCECIGMER